MKRRTIIDSLILSFVFLFSSYSFALITSSDDISSRYEIVGIISDNVVVLKDKQTGSSLTRRLGEPLSQELKISKIDSKSITLTSSIMGENFILNFDKFGSTVASPSSTPAPSSNPNTSVASGPTYKPNASLSMQQGPNSNPNLNPNSNPSSNISDELLPETLGSTSISSNQAAASSSSEQASADSVPAVSELSSETLDLLDKFYEDPDSFSSEQIKDLEKRLLEGI